MLVTLVQTSPTPSIAYFLVKFFKSGIICQTNFQVIFEIPRSRAFRIYGSFLWKIVFRKFRSQGGVIVLQLHVKDKYACNSNYMSLHEPFQFQILNDIKYNCLIYHMVSWPRQLELPSIQTLTFCRSWVRVWPRTEKMPIIFFPALFFFLFSSNLLSHAYWGCSQTMWTGKGEGK